MSFFARANRLTGLLLVFFCFLVTHGAMAQTATPGTMSDYWGGKAQWKFVRKWTSTNSAVNDAGSSIIRVANGAWYMFSRAYVGGTCPNSTMAKLGIQVFKSTDKGATWTNPTLAIGPTAGKPWSCAATDGDVIYDAAKNKWRLLFQCLGDDMKWRGCYAERTGADPSGPFTAVAQNPVIQSGSLWNKICNSPDDDCVSLPGGTGKVIDEGTFNIVRFDGQYFWVSFHGYVIPGTSPNGQGLGFRGLAKTTDFITWIAGDPTYGTPSDAIMDLKDALSWRESWQGKGPIGAGHGNTIEEGGYFYQLVEMADMDLSCTPGQNWDFGLFRTNSLTSTQWQQFPLGNPIIYSSKALEGSTSRPCNVQYAQIFKDTTVTPNVIYLKYGRESVESAHSGTYLYRLDRSSNLLKNGDLWMATDHAWNRLPVSPTNIAVYRYPNLSSDGNQFLATNCGKNPCNPGQSIYQDVDVTAHRGKKYKFGGKFSAHAGTGGLSLVVFQLDQNFAILQSNSVPVTASAGSYRSVTSSAFTILSNTKYLRYQFYLNSGAVTYFADEMFVNLQ